MNPGRTQANRGLDRTFNSMLMIVKNLIKPFWEYHQPPTASERSDLLHTCAPLLMSQIISKSMDVPRRPENYGDFSYHYELIRR